MADQYEVLEELGSGSFGVVYKGVERATGEIVAIKHIDLESSEDDIQDIQQEISVLSTCDSPFVTQYKASFLRGHKLWIIMEYLGGGSCLDLLKAGTFTEAQVAVICREILLGLDYLHRESKIHRDVKAANILLALSGKVKLADFGVAAQLTNIKSQRNTFVGTPFWMAPEVIQQAGYDFKADLWSLGITAMELIQGQPPNASTHPMKALFLIPKAPAPRLEGDGYSREIKDFIISCLVKDPDRRPSASELLQHRFIKNAGGIEVLKDLVARRDSWEATHGEGRTPKFYEETLKGSGQDPEQDSWLFDTIKAPLKQPELKEPVCRQELQVAPSIETSTMRRIEHSVSYLAVEELRQARPTTGTAVHLNTARRRQSMTNVASDSVKRRPQTRQALAPSSDFGNRAGLSTKGMRNAATQSQSKDSSILDENQPPLNEKTMPAPAIEQMTLPDIISFAIEDAQAMSKDHHTQQLLSNIMSAWKELAHSDEESRSCLLRAICQRSASHPGVAAHTSHIATSTPSKPKLVLASSNPHLKSHRRRQSSLLQPGDIWAERPLELPGSLTPGMEHTKHLTDVLYAKWTEGLRNRWPVC